MEGNPSDNDCQPKSISANVTSVFWISTNKKCVLFIIYTWDDYDINVERMRTKLEINHDFSRRKQNQNMHIHYGCYEFIILSD